MAQWLRLSNLTSSECIPPKKEEQEDFSLRNKGVNCHMSPVTFIGGVLGVENREEKKKKKKERCKPRMIRNK